MAFVSDSRNLLTGTQDAAWGFFVRDREKGITTRVGLQPRETWMDTVGGATEALSMGMYGPAISGDGKWVAFVEGPNVMVSRVDGSDREVASVNSEGQEAGAQSDGPSISYDGSYVAFSSWSDNLVSAHTGGGSQVYVRNRPMERRIIPNAGYAALILIAAAAAVARALSSRVRRRERRL